PLLQKEVLEINPKLASQVETYLNSLKTIEADFVQMDQTGTPSAGKFYLQRPGKFRWEYLKGQQILIISNGSQIVYYDKKLNEVTYIPGDAGVAGFLAQNNIKFSGDIKLLSI